ncbi:hypothetical protein HBP99_05685 [Listeria booriae]|uniref:hypothetical protein n=1 Tax=Listeria booriae TaxID=1552123 RepID=UPI00162894D5|nr:hypothetical protein [Listeria booriae]MBC2368116.1 hypothetical protein [Listeria booriae]
MTADKLNFVRGCYKNINNPIIKVEKAHLEYLFKLAQQQVDKSTQKTFWGIKDYKDFPTDEQYADRIVIFDGEETSYRDKQSFVEYFFESYDYDELSREQRDFIRNMSDKNAINIEELLHIVQLIGFCKCYYTVPVVEQGIITNKILFEDEAAAKLYIGKHCKHFSERAYPIPMIVGEW